MRTNTARIKREEENNKKYIPHYIVLTALFILGFVVYYGAFTKGIFMFDDQKLILDNLLIKDFSHIKEIFTSQLFKGSGTYSNFYRPIQHILLMLEYNFWKLNPFGYHLVNVLIHIFNSIGVYFLIYLISKRQDIGFIAGLMFTVHTVLSGPVYYVSASADLIMAFFLLMSFNLYLLYKKAKKYNYLFYIGSFLTFLTALLSKETAVVLPFVILFYLYCFSDKKIYSDKKIPDLIWIFFIVIAIYACLRFTVLNFTQGKLLETTTGQFPLYARLLTTSKVFMLYIRLLLVPTGLHMEWDITPANSIFQDEIFLSVVGLLIIGSFIYNFYRKSKLKFFAIGWFFITLIPYSNIYPLAYFMGEGWLYIPSIGFFALIAIFLSDLRKRSKIWSWAVIGILIFAIVFYSILTIKRSDVWKDPVALYTEALKYSPKNTKARINLGVVLEKAGFKDEARARYAEAVKLNPENLTAHINTAVLYFNKQMYDEALKEFEKVISLNPKDYITYNDIGVCYKKKGDSKKAIEAYKKAIELNPDYAVSYNNIGNIYIESDRYDDAIESYKKAISLDSNKGAFYGNLGKALENKGMIKEAKEAFQKALSLDPNNKDAADSLNAL